MIEFKHPEQLAGEIYLTNSVPDDYPHVGWRSKRIGNTAYALLPSGTGLYPLGRDSRLRPMFVSVEELRQAGQLEGVSIAYGGAVRILYDEAEANNE